MAPRTWTIDRKTAWKEEHPCVNKDGSPPKTSTGKHNARECEYCGVCLRCPPPPWCNKEKHKERRDVPPTLQRRPRKRKSDTLPTLTPISSPGSEVTLSPMERRTRFRTGSGDNAAISPSPGPSRVIFPTYNSDGSSDGDDDVAKYLKEQKEAKEQASRLPSRTHGILAELEDLRSSRALHEKATKLFELVTTVMNRIAKNDSANRDREVIQQHLAKRLSTGGSFSRGVKRLSKNITDLIVNGSSTVRRVATSLLLVSFTVEDAKNILLDNDYTEKRKERVVKNKQAINERRQRAAVVTGRTPELLDTTSSLKFANPFSHSEINQTHRKLFHDHLLQGRDVPPQLPTTKISVETMEYTVAWIFAQSHYRPGKVRHCTVRKSKLKHLPFLLRYTPVYELYNRYCNSLEDVASIKAVGRNSFRTIVGALTRTGTFNQGLSYYYVDHIDNMNQVRALVRRLFIILNDVNDTTTGDARDSVTAARDLVSDLGLQADLASKYLRHDFYGRIKEECDNVYISAKYALGGTDATGTPSHPETDPLLLALTLKQLMYKVSDTVRPLVRDVYSDELESIKGMADVVHCEMLHYIKHIMRGWWQERQEEILKETVKRDPTTLFVVLDHKSKTYPISKFESMAEFFGKNGMSDLGAMVMWFGKNSEGKEGYHVFFYDIIMDNISSQDARDLMPGLEALLKELQSPEFLRIYDRSKPRKIILCSDNKLSNAALTPFIEYLNAIPDSIEIREWINNEAQRGKGILDTHFRYVNLLLNRAVLQGEMKLSDPKAFFDCLCYQGGMSGSAVLSVEEHNCAQEVFDVCKGVKYDKSNVTRIHHISWKRGDENDRIIHRHFTNLRSVNGGFKEFKGKDLMPNLTGYPSTGKTVKRHYSAKPHMFIPLKTGNTEARAFVVDTDNEYTPPPSNTFAGRLYEAAKRVHDLGITPESLLEKTREEIDAGGNQEQRDSVQVNRLLTIAKTIAQEQQVEFPPKMNHYWAMKKNKSWMQPSEETAAEVIAMYNQGKGFKNKATRYSAEQGVAELREKFLLDKWDQRIVVTVKIVKAKFSQWFRKEKKDADNNAKQQLQEAESEPQHLHYRYMMTDLNLVQDDDILNAEANAVDSAVDGLSDDIADDVVELEDTREEESREEEEVEAADHPEL